MAGKERLRLGHPSQEAEGSADERADVTRANGRRSKVRSKVEHVFVRQKGAMRLFIRTIGIARAEVKIGMANLAYNLTRLVWHQGRSVPA